jgi:hypothetical protein
MKHFAAESFWQRYDALPTAIREVADKNFRLLKTDPKHPSLQFKKVGRLWSARVGRNYRALAIEELEAFVWFWIGTHADYDQMLR